MRQIGIQLRDCLIQNSLVSGVTSFHSPMKKEIIQDYSEGLPEP